MHSTKFLALAAALTLTAGSSFAQVVTDITPPTTTKIEVGVAYSRGDYGLTEDTTVFAVPVSISWESGPWTLRATLPWIMIDGPASVIGDGGAGGPVRPITGNESGLGDSSVALSYKFMTGADDLNVSMTGRIKLPTGDEDRGLGTGKVDEYLQVDLFRTYGSVTPFGTIGYRWLGDGIYQLKDGFYASGGLLFTVAPGMSIGASYEWRDALVAGGDDASEGSLIFFKRFNDSCNGSLTVTKGFSDASADLGIAMQVSHTF